MRRFNMGHRGVVAAFEQEEIIAAAAAAADPAEPVNQEPELTVVEDPANSAETEIIEANDLGADIEAGTQEVEESVGIVEALESIADDLKLSMANGGMDRYSASALGRSVQYMYGRVGIERPVTMSMEAFGGTTSKIEATRIAMEDIKETAKKAWAGIIAAIERLIQWGKDFYTKVFTSYEKIGARAEEIIKKGNEVGSKTAKETEFENERIAKGLAIAGKVDVNAIVGNSHLDAFAAGLGFQDKSLPAYDDTIRTFESSKTDEEFLSKFETPGADFGGAFTKVSNPESSGYAVPKERLTLFVTQEMPGGKAIALRYPAETLKGKDAIDVMGGGNGLGGSLVDFEPSKKKDAPSKIATLKSDEIVKLAEKVKSLCAAAEGYKGTLDKVAAVKKKMVDAVKKVSTNDEDMKSAQKAASAMSVNLDQPSGAINIYLLNTCKTMLDYASESLKQYGAGDVKKEEGKPADLDNKSAEKPEGDKGEAK